MAKKQKRQKKPKNKKIEAVISFLMGSLILFGILAMLYPLVSDELNQFVNQQRLSYYQTKTDKKVKKDREKQMEEFNKKLKKTKNIAVMDPFEEENREAVKVTSFADYIIGNIIIPKIRINIPIYNQTNDPFLEEGAALLNGTSFPLGGENTHAVISAHRGLPDKKFFTDLPDMSIGDPFILNVADKKLAYEVESITVIEPTDLTWLTIEEGRDIVTLMTCTPYMVNSHRLLVKGHRIPYTAELDEEIKKVDNHHKLLLIGLGVLLLLLFLLYFYWLYRRRKKRKKELAQERLNEG
ncbi:class C sortase [Enterococcus florum]|uniref:Class C sortase n=1 Tax=Enterococcus florum TaxID=2480627 RepID=A0A4P5PGJ4_9ENTE|nr:class C sortase [Enterococcus florum]GCF94772.1 class C sortase [Enterococcus florum]